MVKKTSENKKSGIENIIPGIKWDESYVSLAIGVVVVIIIAVIGIAFLRNTDNTDTSSALIEPVLEDEAEEPGQTITNEEGKTIYVVKSGDTLWSISEDQYKSGYNWVDISKTNKIVNPNLITEGTKLEIPEVKAKTVTAIEESGMKEAMKKVPDPISDDNYTVKKGDNLWSVAVRAYGDGYSWVKIAEANRLDNPDIIYAGNVIKLPR